MLCSHPHNFSTDCAPKRFSNCFICIFVAGASAIGIIYRKHSAICSFEEILLPMSLIVPPRMKITGFPGLKCEGITWTKTDGRIAKSDRVDTFIPLNQLSILSVICRKINRELVKLSLETYRFLNPDLLSVTEFRYLFCIPRILCSYISYWLQIFTLRTTSKNRTFQELFTFVSLFQNDCWYLIHCFL